MLREEKGVVYEGAVPRWAIEVTLVKRQLMEYESVDQKTGEAVKTMRTAVKSVDRGVSEFTDAN